ncbi:uncharacterized protein N7459_001224 [Penicillium hispanicum]|uniref:uncharacterized protein n=1 Tax=Penicillium hispanicum TaxID=1080232 RepID=UPI00254168BF|nr:uncharacterized protein N7459_001224 [Penicillium hispanicum]KAJ5595016.1 hypothetical protein N7459_001224 [Penicillium hispanicum]
MELDEEFFSFLFRHIFMPPKLPQAVENNLPNSESRLVVLVKEALDEFIQSSHLSNQAQWSTPLNMLETWIIIDTKEGVSQDSLAKALANISSTGAIACHIRAQNCGMILFHNKIHETVIVDAFEVSAKSASVMASSGLLRRFPGISVALPAEKFNDPSFCSYLASSISQLASEEVEMMLPTAKKANTEVVEHRDTAHPGLVTEGLMVQLLALGTLNEDCPLVKSVHDEVNWKDVLLPWRRSPVWLVLRVALQMVLQRCFLTSEGRIQYKNFILYFMATLGAKAFAHTKPRKIVERLEIIRAKLGRRIYKMGDSVTPFVAACVHSTTQDIFNHLEMMQQVIKTSETSETTSVSSFSPSASQKDLRISLVNSLRYIEDAMCYSSSEVEVRDFDRPHKPGIILDSYGLPVLQNGSIMALTEFEHWVDKELQLWCFNVKSSGKEAACGLLHSVLKAYWGHAHVVYKDNPQATSTMILVLLELWMNVDKMAMEICPLMKDFPPEVPKESLQALLLPRKSQMRRASVVENHIQARIDRQKKNNPSIFADPGPKSFSVRFFGQSQSHQALERRIEEYANRRQGEKRNEWETLTARYKELCDQASSESKHYHAYNRRDQLVHMEHRCRKCSFLRSARAMEIEVYEWPLPSQSEARMAAVFELDVPPWFVSWRDATWQMVHDVAQRETTAAGEVPKEWLTYPEIERFVVNRGQRITLGSDTKSFTSSHYRARKFPVSLDAVCVPNALHMRVFDQANSVWATDQKGLSMVKSLCTIKIPHGSYSNLQHAVDSTKHTQNGVMADQHKCNAKLSLHEFIAYGCLRSGERVQWYNILRELVSSAFSMHEQAVASLVKQAAWEFGSPSNSELRQAHQAFEDPNFGVALFGALQNRLAMIEGNWNEYCSLDVLVTLGLRLLTLSTGSPANDQIANFLRQCREIATKWCEELNQGLHDCCEDDSRARQHLILQITATCQATYDTDSEHFKFIFNCPRDLFCFVRSSIFLFENLPVDRNQLPCELRCHLDNSERIRSLVIEDLYAHVKLRPATLSEAIQHSIGCLELSGLWNFLDGGWVNTATQQTNQSRQQQIHYNLLTGELLVDGYPPGRLPSEFMESPIYAQLFGSVRRSRTRDNVEGELTSQKVDGFEVHFGMDESGLLVRTRKATQIFQLIPYKLLLQDFPATLVVDNFHWLDPATGTLEFRPKDQPWMPCEQNWRLTFDPQAPNKRLMRQNSKLLVDVHSSLFANISEILQVLDSKEHIIIVQTATSVIEVELTRMRLRFFINENGAIESKEFNSLVDSNQDAGCFYGLRNKLVLRGKNGLNRSVIVPYGCSESARTDKHVEITIKLPDEKRLRYMYYSIDNHLQMLRGPPDLLASLHQAYLHALTTFPLHDPLTGRSGTEEALRILNQECLKTSLPLSEECVLALERIAALTPRRAYYPNHLRVMQTVHWRRSIGQLAQHGDFRVLAENILSFSSKFSVFYATQPRICSMPHKGDSGLWNRASALHARFRSSEFGGACPSLLKPTYDSRDSDTKSARSQRVYEVAALVRDWPSTMDHSGDLVNIMQKSPTVYTSAPALQDLTCSETLCLSVAESWVSMYRFCQSKSRAHSYSLISHFATIAFGGQIDLSIIRQLLLVAFLGDSVNIRVPSGLAQSLRMRDGESFIRSEIEAAIGKSYARFVPKQGTSLDQKQLRKRNKKEEGEWATQRSEDLRVCSDIIKDQWPCEEPTLPQIPRVKRHEALAECRNLCTRWMQNHRFLEFLREVQDRLLPLRTPDQVVESIPSVHLQFNPVAYRSFQPPSLLELVQKSSDMLRLVERSDPIPHLAILPSSAPTKVIQSGPTSELCKLAGFFTTDSDVCHREYGKGLWRSIQALHRFSKVEDTTESENEIRSLSALQKSRHLVLQHLAHSQEIRDILWDNIQRTLKSLAHFSTNCSVTVYPSITVWSILSLLRSSKWPRIPDSWKQLLVSFGKSISSLRRCERLIAYIDSSDADAFFKELETPGYENWDPLTYPDWLLLEIENDITIRNCQAEVAMKMIDPEGKSALLQLNMGEGKTSVITPMKASVLADGSQLLRIIVLKPLLPQSMRLLSERLGGLINRRIYHIPFSRQTKIDQDLIATIRSLTRECRKNRGVLIALPEHILSFRLVGLDCAGSDPSHFKPLVTLEHELQGSCRDVIDESDEVLDTKFQLVYTVGTQQGVDGLSERWETTQHLLGLVAAQAKKLQDEDFGCIQVDQSGYRYPLLRFLTPKAMEKLTYRLLEAISQNALPGLPFSQWSPKLRQATLEFILQCDVTEAYQNIVRSSFDGGIVITKLLVLRGLFAFRILEFALATKRWLVDYGLHPSRCMMAVPYRAKGVPSENAEFGHPDVAIVLTCLSYYYGGLTTEQLRDCFGLLSKVNDPSSEYQNWIASCSSDLPKGYRALSRVNLKDDRLFDRDLFPFLQYQKPVIDFYLSHLVFPREAKEFPRKLSTSAWDIPAQPGLQITTGFSGTNDNRFLLPHSIEQRDLAHLLHTNAMVLGYLLQERNRKCILAQDQEGRQLSVDRLLKLICQKCNARVLIDVGAQILEAGNRSVATAWLSMAPDEDVEAAIFFDHKDELMVVDREGHVESLSSSAFRQRLGSCLVFLDQHHSRGVDLKLPPQTRAAVTLGPRLTKDKLVQACNRLRGLEKRQSVVFLVPPEVAHNMAALLGPTFNPSYTSADVLKWAMIQTCQALDNLRPLWADHGLRHYRRIALWNSIVQQTDPSKELATCMQEPEARTLNDLYSPWANLTHSMDDLSLGSDTSDSRLQELRDALQSAVGNKMATSYLHEEQEREIACEVEREQQVCRPPSYTPHEPSVHSDIWHFVKFGKFPSARGSSAVKLAFSSLGATSVGATTYPESLGGELYVTIDFDRTVKMIQGGLMDEFCKPVNWILSSVHSDILIILSQHEANMLLPLIRESENATLHVYTPRLTKPMPSFRHLDFFNVGATRENPPSDRMTRDLELFAGSLYFTSFEEYSDFRSFLGLVTESLDDLPDGAVSNEGFVDKHTRKSLQWPIRSPFKSNPLPFLRALIHIRCKGQGYQQTHVGTVIAAKPLAANRF